MGVGSVTKYELEILLFGPEPSKREVRGNVSVSKMAETAFWASKQTNDKFCNNSA